MTTVTNALDVNARLAPVAWRLRGNEEGAPLHPIFAAGGDTTDAALSAEDSAERGLDMVLLIHVPLVQPKPPPIAVPCRPTATTNAAAVRSVCRSASDVERQAKAPATLARTARRSPSRSGRRSAA